MSIKKVLDGAEKNVAADLAKKVSQPLPPLVKMSATGHMVRELRALGAGGLTAAERLNLRRSTSDRVADYLAEQRLNITHLGLSPDVVTRYFVQTVEETPAKSFRRLPRINPLPVGREGDFNGRLFQHAVLNNPAVHRKLAGIAREECGELNRLIASDAKGRILDLDGKDLTLPGTFAQPILATNFWLRVDDKGEWKQFMDGAYLSRSVLPGGGPGRFWALPVGLEVKRPGSVGEFRSQQGEMLGRLTEAKWIKMQLPGSAEHTEILTRDFAFSTDRRLLLGLTASLTNGEDYNFLSTATGGYTENIVQIDLVLDTTVIDRLSRLLWQGRF